MQGVNSKGTHTTLADREGESHMGLFNTGMGLDLTGIQVRSSNNHPKEAFYVLSTFHQ
jgi:hypothetical protein